jgi:flavin-dependent dehydrogenase
MAKSSPQPDVLVLGEHPCAYLAAALLKAAQVRVIHGKIPGEEHPDRLVVINPAVFALHPFLEKAKAAIDLVDLNGLQFLADDPATASEYRDKSVAAHIASFKQVRTAMCKIAEEHEIKAQGGDVLEIHGVDETGVDVTVGRSRFRTKLILLAGALPAAQQRILGMPEAWDAEVLHRYSFLKLKGPRWLDRDPRPLMPMSLDLNGSLSWAWLLPGDGCVQLAVEAPLEKAGIKADRAAPARVLRRWMDVLIAHKILKGGTSEPDFDAATSLVLPLAGALSQDGVANRTLLFGPAGGFYSACAEDIYPCCWSALFAVESARKALKETFLQDALQQYRNRWGATLGDYLRGPQQNLRFLLPMVYRNRTMTERLAQAILSGESVVR